LSLFFSIVASACPWAQIGSRPSLNGIVYFVEQTVTRGIRSSFVGNNSSFGDANHVVLAFIIFQILGLAFSVVVLVFTRNPFNGYVVTSTLFSLVCNVICWAVYGGIVANLVPPSIFTPTLTLEDCLVGNLYNITTNMLQLGPGFAIEIIVFVLIFFSLLTSFLFHMKPSFGSVLPIDIMEQKHESLKRLHFGTLCLGFLALVISFLSSITPWSIVYMSNNVVTGVTTTEAYAQLFYNFLMQLTPSTSFCGTGTTLTYAPSVIPVMKLPWLGSQGYPDLTNANNLAIAFTVLEIVSIALTCWLLYRDHKSGWFSLFTSLFALCCNLVAWISYCILLGTEYNGGVLEFATVNTTQYSSGISGIWSAGFGFAIANTPFLIVLCSMIAFAITNKPQIHSLTSTYHIQMKQQHSSHGERDKQYDSQESIPEEELQKNNESQRDMPIEVEEVEEDEREAASPRHEDDSHRRHHRHHRHRGRRDDDEEEEEDEREETVNDDEDEDEDRGRNKRRHHRNAVI
jgi:hypothetical protein